MNYQWLVKSLATVGGVASAVYLGQLSAQASEGPMAIAAPLSTMEQVTSVSQLSDVKPTDWAFQSLQSLVERYGCIAGYPDRWPAGSHGR